MAVSECFVSVIAPLADDADIVESFVRETSKVMRDSYADHELVLVSDGSTDETVAKVTELLGEIECIRLIRLTRSFGQEVAISAGLDAVIGDFVVILLPEADPPALIPLFVEEARRSTGIIFGVRQARGAEPVLLRLGAKLFYSYCNRILKLNLPRNASYFRVLSRQSVNSIIQIKDRLRFLRMFSADIGHASRGIPYEPSMRRGRARPRKLFEAVSFGVGLIVANSTHPLRMASWLGLAVSGLNLLYMVYIVLIYLFKKRVAEGWVTLSLQNATMFFCLFLFLTVLCEYIGRIAGGMRDRPLYYVLEERNSSVAKTGERRTNVVGESSRVEER
ncbi:MAG: glycosyltransferase [Planctomycetota bacterium]